MNIYGYTQYVDMAELEPVASFTLVRYPKWRKLRAVAHLGLDRWPLAHTPGLHFWRLLGVGKGNVFSPYVDLQRYALFTVWDSLAALRQFEEGSGIMRTIRLYAEEVWTVYMCPVRWHGAWGGGDPFQHITPASAPEPGPWIVLTRATLRLAHVRAFLHAVPAVAEQLLQQPELMKSVGIGEAPLLYQATFSLWRSLPGITSFAYSSAQHRDVIGRTRQEHWYREELFARLRPVASYGTWDGTDPLI